MCGWNQERGGRTNRPLIDKAALLKLPIDPEPLLAQWRKKGLKV
jgi:hypothetical protein